MDTIKLFAPAKINLTLDINGRRRDGYHLISSVMQTLDFGDIVTLKLNSSGKITLASNFECMPLDERNIAHKAASAFLKKAGISQGVEIFIEKNIPTMAGLGGGSADGAAVLVGINELLGRPYTTEELMQIGETVGADIPFLIVGGTCLVEGIGEKVKRLAALPQCFIALAKPEVGVSTKACFEAYAKNHSQSKKTQKPPLEALEQRNLQKFAQGVFNVLEPAANLPEVEVIKKSAVECGALAACMTGTGSTVFALFEDVKAAETHTIRMAKEGYWTHICQPNALGIKILP